MNLFFNFGIFILIIFLSLLFDNVISKGLFTFASKSLYLICCIYFFLKLKIFANKIAKSYLEIRSSLLTFIVPKNLFLINFVITFDKKKRIQEKKKHQNII